MPSKSKKQHNFMEMVAHNPKMAKKVGVPQSVGKDFVAADKRKKFSTGERPDLQKANIKKTDHGQSTLFKEGGIMKPVDMKKNPGVAKLPTAVRNKMGFMKKGGMACDDSKEDTKMDKVQDKAMLKKAFKQHDAQEHKGGKGTKLALKKGGPAKCMAKGGGIEVKGKTRGKMC